MIHLICCIVVCAALAACSTPTQRRHGDVVVGGKAVFRHMSKMEKLDCTECHDKLYTSINQHKTAEMDPAIFQGEQSCGTCHNGTRAFSVRGNCDKCHRK